MILPKFQYHEPKTLDEATKLMSDIGKEASVLAGGTDLLVNMKKNKVSPKHVVYLSHIEELRKVSREKGAALKVGACMTACELSEHQAIKADFNGLAEAAGVIGSPLIRNLATIGGNIITARPAADMLPPLISYGASAVLKSAKGERTLPLEGFFKGPGQTMLEANEILAGVVMPIPAPCSGGAYIKFGVRQALEISVVNVAAFLATDGGVIKDARIVMGAVGPVPLRAPTAEAALIGNKPDEALFAAAAEAAASKDAKPIDDFRGSAEYRRDLVKVLTTRALRHALENLNLRERRNG